MASKENGQKNCASSNNAHFIKPYRSPVHFINRISVRFMKRTVSKKRILKMDLRKGDDNKMSIAEKSLLSLLSLFYVLC